MREGQFHSPVGGLVRLDMRRFPADHRDLDAVPSGRCHPDRCTGSHGLARLVTISLRELDLTGEHLDPGLPQDFHREIRRPFTLGRPHWLPFLSDPAITIVSTTIICAPIINWCEGPRQADTHQREVLRGSALRTSPGDSGPVGRDSGVAVEPEAPWEGLTVSPGAGDTGARPTANACWIRRPPRLRQGQADT